MRNAFIHLRWFFKQEWKHYLFLAFLLLLLSAIQVIPAKILGMAIDEIEGGTITVQRLLYLLAGLLLIPLLRYFLNIIYHYRINKLGYKISYQLQERYIDYLFELDAATYEKYTKGDLIARATNDLQNLTNFATSFLQNVVYNFGVIIAAIVSMFIIDPLLSLASILVMPILINWINRKRVKKRAYYKTHQEIYSNMTENVLESIEGARTVRAYCNEEADFQKTKVAIDADINSWWYIIRFESLYGPLFETVYSLCYFVAIGLGAYLVITSRISTGDLLTFLMYVGMLYGPLIALSNVLNTMNNIIISDTRYHEILNIKPAVKDDDNPVPVIDFQEITFQNVRFRYPFDNFDVIKGITFSIKSGETIGIVGPTGAGKSTLIRQLLREFNVTDGKILIDGRNITHFKIDDVRNLVGYVPQDHILFHRSVDDNIHIGNPQANRMQVETAVTLADFKKDLKALPYGIETMVAEMGGSLSGGQRQRLSIARALVKNPEILILDDSLSAVDALTEKNIIEHLKEGRKGKTNIIVAHRFSAIAAADKIIVLQNGQITDVGTHQELLKYDNWYKMQYLKQIAGESHEEL